MFLFLFPQEIAACKHENVLKNNVLRFGSFSTIGPILNLSVITEYS